MSYGIAADLLVAFHFCFVGFVIFGGLLVLRYPLAAFAHIPAACWGVIVEWSGWICPLTPLENYLREQGGGAGYQGGFVDHYIMPVLYPDGLTRTMQYELGALILIGNIVLYVLAFRRWKKQRAIKAPVLVASPAPGGDVLNPPST